MELTLTTEEWELLLEILGERHGALLREISHTDHREFKLALRRREKIPRVGYEPSPSHATNVGTDGGTSPLRLLAVSSRRV